MGGQQTNNKFKKNFFSALSTKDKETKNRKPGDAKELYFKEKD